MLQKLLDTVPNITPERSALGGFSNGAHTVAVLLAGQDEFILRNFRSFFFVEGGSPLAANALQKLSMKRNRFLVLVGDQLKGVPTHEALILVARSLEYSARERQLDLTSILMRGAGHEMPPKYAAQIGQWVRGEKITEPDEQYSCPSKQSLVDFGFGMHRGVIFNRNCQMNHQSPSIILCNETDLGSAALVEPWAVGYSRCRTCG